AIASAWASPARRCQPVPTIRPARTTIAPTGGLGLVRPSPRRASASACCMKARSRAEASAGRAARERDGRSAIPARSGAGARRRARPGTTAAFSGGRLLRAGTLRAAALLQQILELLHELADVLERPIDGGKAHVGNRVEVVQLAHDRLADHRARHFLLAPLLDRALDPVHRLLDRLDAHRPLLAGLLQPRHHLLAIEGLATTVFLDDR